MSASLKPLFQLRPDITYLNFGSFGACPKPIFETYLDFERELEQEPVQFITVNGPRYLQQSKEALAKYINCNAEDLVFTPNPTFAINIVAKNLRLNPGDEVLSTNLEYGALERTWEYFCSKSNARFVRQQIQLPVTSKETLIDEFWKGFSKNTKAIFISQITSVTGIILPVKEICEEAKKRGLITIVDGAHVPGHVKLDLTQIEADIYTGACHKWMMTPKGSSFLYVKKEFQDDLEPLVVSWGYNSDNPSDSQFLDYHQFNGTRDYSAYLTIPKAIEFMTQHNWEQVSEDCKTLVAKNASRFCELMESNPISPLTNEWLGQLFSVPITKPVPDNLQRILFEKYHIEVPVMRQNGNTFIRYSINGFNHQNDLDNLYEALKELTTNPPLDRPKAN